MYLRLIPILLLLSVIWAGCEKSKGPTLAQPIKSSYTSLLKGVRHWRGSHSYVAAGPNPIYESYYCPDTTFELTMVSDYSVKIGASSFSYERTDTPNRVNYFGQAYYYLQNGNGKGVAYYFEKDSIVVYNGSKHNAGNSWEYKDVYWTYKF